MAAKSDKSPKQGKGALEEEVWSAIGAFEQILEAMPNDRASLEALLHAYEQIGDLVKAKEYLVRLANVLVEESDVEAGADLLERLKTFAADDAEVAQLVATLEALAPAGAGTRSAGGAHAEPAETDAHAAKSKGGPPVRMVFSMADELAFAWNLLEAKELTQEEYASVVQDLTEMSTSESPSTISVLHVMEARGFKNIERVLGYVAKECETPIILPSNFVLNYDTVTILNSELMVKRGIFVFDRVGQDLLLVIMNPYDKQLRKEVEAQTGRKCHFFVTLPSEFDRALGKANEIITEKQAQASAQ